MAGLRERNRRAAMRLAQRSALELFLERGFAAVTVEEVALGIEVSASTIYRHFGTKEALVLWDEHEAEVDAALEDRLRRMPPLEALREGFVEAIGRRYEADRTFQLQRVAFIYATEALHGAAVRDELRARAELTAGLQQVLSRKHRRAAAVLAGAALLALDLALDEWQRQAGKRSLEKLISDSFGALEDLGSIR